MPEPWRYFVLPEHQSEQQYDPSVDRFLARDPLGCALLFFADQPYAYAGNNPISNMDPSGQYRAVMTSAGAWGANDNVSSTSYLRRLLVTIPHVFPWITLSIWTLLFGGILIVGRLAIRRFAVGAQRKRWWTISAVFLYLAVVCSTVLNAVASQRNEIISIVLTVVMVICGAVGALLLARSVALLRR